MNKELVRIGYRGPHRLARTLAELIEDDDGHVRWLVPPDPHWDTAVGTASGLNVDHVMEAARLFVTRYPDTRVRVNGSAVRPLRSAFSPRT